MLIFCVAALMIGSPAPTWLGPGATAARARTRPLKFSSQCLPPQKPNRPFRHRNSEKRPINIGSFEKPSFSPFLFFTANHLAGLKMSSQRVPMEGSGPRTCRRRARCMTISICGTGCGSRARGPRSQPDSNCHQRADRQGRKKGVCARSFGLRRGQNAPRRRASPMEEGTRMNGAIAAAMHFPRARA